jgi:hypothetical protein
MQTTFVAMLAGDVGPGEGRMEEVSIVQESLLGHIYDLFGFLMDSSVWALLLFYN